MIANELRKSLDKNSNAEVSMKEENRIKMTFELREGSYTRDECDGEVTFEGFKLRISGNECNEATAKYIANALRASGIYNKVEITQDHNYIEFEAWIFGEWDVCKSVKQLETSLYNKREEVQIMLKIFEIYSFELIGLFYYTPSFN